MMRRMILGAMLFAMASLVSFGQDAQVDARQSVRADESQMKQDRVNLRRDVKAGDKAAAVKDQTELRKDARDMRQDKTALKDRIDARADKEARADRKDARTDRRQMRAARTGMGPHGGGHR